MVANGWLDGIGGVLPVSCGTGHTWCADCVPCACTRVCACLSVDPRLGVKDYTKRLGADATTHNQARNLCLPLRAGRLLSNLVDRSFGVLWISLCLCNGLHVGAGRWHDTSLCIMFTGARVAHSRILGRTEARKSRSRIEGSLWPPPSLRTAPGRSLDR